MKRTKIVCTIGPATNTKPMIKQLIKAGMNVARLNFAHGTLPEHKQMIKAIREAAREVGTPIAILQDLPGIKFRVRSVPKAGLQVEAGQTIILGPKPKHETKEIVIPISLDGFESEVKKGDSILFGDGMLTMHVEKNTKKGIVCKVMNDGLIRPGQGINIPTLESDASVLTRDDIEKATFGVQENVDFIALSFVRRAEDINELRRIITKMERERRHEIKLIAKIEKPEALRYIDEIIEAADGIMIARGDLGVETPLEQLPIVQKQLITKCLAASKPVITATQMLLSMVDHPRPTRSEATDVANAVIDHTDAVMLSEETARGNFPLETVKTMARIVEQAENSVYARLYSPADVHLEHSFDTAIGESVTSLAKEIDAKAILVASLSGDTARKIARFRPSAPMLVTTHSYKVERQLQLIWGVVPIHLPVCRSVDELIEKATHEIKSRKLVKKGDKIVIVAGHPVGEPGNVNMIKVHEIE